MDSWGIHQEPPPPASVLSEPRQLSLSVPVTGLGPWDWGRNWVLVAILRQLSPVLGTGGPLQAPLPRTRSRSPAGQSSVHCQQLWLWFFSMRRGHLEMSVLCYHLKNLIRPAWENFLVPGWGSLCPAWTPAPLLCQSSKLWTLTTAAPSATSPWHLPSLTLTHLQFPVFQVRKPLPSGGLSTPWHHALGWHSSL